MIGYKNRQVEGLKQSQVYFNLHKKVFSVKQGNLVVLHTEEVILTDVTFKVNEAGRQRVLQEQRKNVHAFVNGKFLTNFAVVPGLENTMREAYYNPYKTETFVDKETGEPIHRAAHVYLKGKKIFYKN